MDDHAHGEQSTEGDRPSDEPPPTLMAEPSPPGLRRRAPTNPLEEKGNPLWADWRWQMASRIRRLGQLKAAFPAFQPSRAQALAAARFPMAITPYYASLIQRTDPSDPIFALSVPLLDELIDPPFLRDDPLEEDADTPVPGLVHRYPDRALLIASTACGSYCRHCTRKRVAGQAERVITQARLAQIVAYLRAHPEIRDVIVSGGDPLSMTTEALERVLRAIRSAPSVEIIRIGTRAPVVLPMRITEELVAMLRRYHPIWVNTHFNHPTELTPEATEACARLADAGIPVGNQSVLLRGVNDEPRLLEELFRGLVRRRVRPYYLYQCDLVRGVEHFRTPLSRGIEVMEYLRGRLSGLAIPTFVVDAPHGGGKIPVLPSYIVSMSPTHTVLRNFEGQLVSYPEPGAPAPESDAPRPSAGVWGLATGRETCLGPEALTRLARRGGAPMKSPLE